MYYTSTLYHHGVKGMKWGVRKKIEPSSSTRNTSEDDKNNKKNTIFTKKNMAIGAAATLTAVAVIGTAVYIHKSKNLKPIMHIKEWDLSKKTPLDKMSDMDTVIKQGTKFQRISSKKVEDYTKEGSRIYTSYLNKDNRLYERRMPDEIKKWADRKIVEGDGSAYKHILKADKDIKIASERATAKAFMKATNSKEYQDWKYLRFSEKLVDRKDPEVKRFFEELAKAGYNGVKDSNDAGWTKDPLILFNTEVLGLKGKSNKLGKIDKIINVMRS